MGASELAKTLSTRDLQVNKLIQLVTPGLQYDHKAVEIPHDFTAPFRVNLETNEICNMGCGFCFADYNEGADAHKQLGLKTQGMLVDFEVQAMMDQTAQMGTKQFLLGGGDPFIRKDMPELIEYAAGLGLDVVVDTNGLILPVREGLFDRVAPHLHQLGLSLDGSNSQTHDTFRETRNSFTRVMRLIELSRGQKYRLKINTIVTAQNAQDIPHMVEVLAPYADVIRRWSLDQFIPVNRGKENEKKYLISDDKYLAVVEQIKALTSGRFNCTTIGGGLKSDKAGTVMMFGPQGIPYVTQDDRKRYLPDSIRTKPLITLVQAAEALSLDLTRMNEHRFQADYYRQ